MHHTLVQTHSTDPVPPHPARVVVHVGKGASGARTGHAAQAASGPLSKKELAP